MPSLESALIRSAQEFHRAPQGPSPNPRSSLASLQRTIQGDAIASQAGQIAKATSSLGQLMVALGLKKYSAFRAELAWKCCCCRGQRIDFPHHMWVASFSGRISDRRRPQANGYFFPLPLQTPRGQPYDQTYDQTSSWGPEGSGWLLWHARSRNPRGRVQLAVAEQSRVSILLVESLRAGIYNTNSC